MQTTVRGYRTYGLVTQKAAFSVLLGMELTPCNPSTCEAGAAQIQGYPGLPITLQNRLGYGKTLLKERKEIRQEGWMDEGRQGRKEKERKGRKEEGRKKERRKGNIIKCKSSTRCSGLQS